MTRTGDRILTRDTAETLKSALSGGGGVKTHNLESTVPSGIDALGLSGRGVIDRLRPVPCTSSLCEALGAPALPRDSPAALTDNGMSLAEKKRSSTSARAAVSYLSALLSGLSHRVACLLQFLRVADIVAFDCVSRVFHTSCHAQGFSGKLIVPVFRTQWNYLSHVDMLSVDTLIADDLRIASTRDNAKFFSALMGCCSLQRLLCATNTNLDIKQLATFVASVPGLLVLDLARNDLARDGPGLQPLFQALPAGLRILDLSHNHLQDEHAFSLSDAIMANSEGGHLEELRIQSNYLADRTGLALAELLCCSAGASLRYLDMRTNRLGTKGSCALLSALEGHSQLRAFRLGYNANNLANDVATAEQASAVLRNSGVCQIEQLDLCNVRMGDEGASIVASSLRVNYTLRVLHLAFNSIGLIGVEALASFLEDNYRLQLLDLRDNCVGDNGASALAKMLLKNTSIRRLLLARNEIGNLGVIALTDALEKTRRVSVDITGNDITLDIRKKFLLVSGLGTCRRQRH